MAKETKKKKRRKGKMPSPVLAYVANKFLTKLKNREGAEKASVLLEHYKTKESLKLGGPGMGPRR
jgi:hypothetical protein